LGSGHFFEIVKICEILTPVKDLTAAVPVLQHRLKGFLDELSIEMDTIKIAEGKHDVNDKLGDIARNFQLSVEKDINNVDYYIVIGHYIMLSEYTLPKAECRLSLFLTVCSSFIFSRNFYLLIIIIFLCSFL
jgi:hypothetical protein